MQHPNADRLRVCRVETYPRRPRRRARRCRSSAARPNARTGLVGVFAPPGTHVPGTGVDLKPGKIRGVESNGMLCSERELMLSDNHDGIIELPADAPLGAALHRLSRPERPGDRDQDHAQPARRARASAASPATSPRAASGTLRAARYPASRAASPAPSACTSTRASRQGLPAFRRPPDPWREERPVARLAAGAAEGHRPAPDLGAGGHHQLSSPSA